MLLSNSSTSTSKTAAILFFPDALVSNRVFSTLSILNELGIHPESATSLQLDFNLMSDIRRYAVKPSTLQAIKMRNMLESAGPSIYITLKTTLADAANPLELLNSAKGSSFPWLRSSESIRTRLGGLHPMIKFFHIPDDSTEMEREQEILRHHRPSEFRNSAYTKSAIKKLILCTQETYTPHDLDFYDSLSRIVGQITNSQDGDLFLKKSELSHQQPRLEIGTYYEWQDMLDFIDEASLSMPLWDIITVCAFLTLVTE